VIYWPHYLMCALSTDKVTQRTKTAANNRDNKGCNYLGRTWRDAVVAYLANLFFFSNLAGRTEEKDETLWQNSRCLWRDSDSPKLPESLNQWRDAVVAYLANLFFFLIWLDVLRKKTKLFDRTVGVSGVTQTLPSFQKAWANGGTRSWPTWPTFFF